jgi:DNA-binding CsgD family transcriptional regulator
MTWHAMHSATLCLARSVWPGLRPGAMPPREQQVLLMTFRGGMSQTQIGQRLRISQMHVSRLRAHALAHLRSQLLNPQQDASLGRPGRSTP